MQQVILQNGDCSLCSTRGFQGGHCIKGAGVKLQGHQNFRKKVNRKFPMGIHLVRHSVPVWQGRWKEFTSTHSN